MGKKRVYVDRSATLKNSQRKPDYLIGVQPVELTKKQMGSFERHYIYKLIHNTLLDCAIAYVMANDICVLTIPEPISASSISFPTSDYHISVSGKKKKGAHRIKPGDILLTLVCANGSIRNIQSPIGGRLIERNERILTSPELLLSDPFRKGYIAVCYPDTPSSLLRPTSHLSTYNTNTPGNNIDTNNNSNVCYAWLKGKCHRETTCRFDHF